MEIADYEQRVAKAHELHNAGFNCAQSVACACADLVDLDTTAAFKLTEGFGGGMGGLTETCGALSGGVALLGYATSDAPDNPTTKSSTYAQVRQLVARFREQNGSTLCNEIQGLTGGPVLRTCPDCVDDGIRMTLDLLKEID